MLEQVTVDADRIAAVAKALAHPARVRIVEVLLARPGCIGGDILGAQAHQRIGVKLF